MFPDPPHDPTTTQGMADRARGGDGDAFGALYERLAPAVFAWASLRTRGGARAATPPEDVVQETWWRALASFKTYDARALPFRAWLFGIASHVLLDAFRRKGVRERSHPGAPRPKGPTASTTPDDATAVSDRVARDETLALAIAKLRALPDEDRALLIGVGLEGATAAAYGAEHGLSADATTKRWQRLRARLRDEGVADALFDG